MTSAETRAIVDSIREAAASCRRNRLRSALSALAVAVAVGTIAVVVESLDGFARSARQTSARAFGSETFLVSRVVASGLGRRELADKLARNPGITRRDAAFLEVVAAGRVTYAPLARRTAEVVAGGKSFENAAIGGTAASLAEIRNLEIDRGRFLNRDEERGALAVVIGADIAAALFPGENPIGRKVRLAGRGFEVVGTQARQGSAGGASLDRNVWMPLRTFERVFGSPDSVEVFGRPLDGGATSRAEDRAVASMRARRRLAPGVPDNFDLLTPEAARTFVERISGSIGAAAGPISLMALLAAVVVVTNTTLVSVSERTREIGVRRAVGASRGRVVLEVLAEATLLAFSGGAAGLAGASALLALLSVPLAVPLPLRATTMAWSLAAAGLTGLAAGWYPARRAARIDVIAATRAE